MLGNKWKIVAIFHCCWFEFQQNAVRVKILLHNSELSDKLWIVETINYYTNNLYYFIFSHPIDQSDAFFIKIIIFM